MGRIVEKVKFTNFETGKSVMVDALVDTDATMISLPQNVVEELGLRKLRDTPVRYANNKTEVKEVYGVVVVEMDGREAEFSVLAEEEGSRPLIGHVVLEMLDLIVDTSARRVVPNPRSPDMPMIEQLAAAPGELRPGRPARRD